MAGRTQGWQACRGCGRLGPGRKWGRCPVCRNEAPPPRPPCRHCQARPANRPKGLCWRCWDSPDIRKRHPSTSPHARRSAAADMVVASLPPAPVAAAPGSEEKIRAMADRVERREATFHPDDGSGYDWRREESPRLTEKPAKILTLRVTDEGDI